MKDNHILSKIILQLVLSPPIPEKCLYIENQKESNDIFFDYEYDILNSDENEILNQIKKDENDLFFDKINEIKSEIKYIVIDKKFDNFIDLYTYCYDLSMKEKIVPRYVIMNSNLKSMNNLFSSNIGNNIMYLLPEPKTLGVLKNKIPLFIFNDKIIQSINIEINPQKMIIFEHQQVGENGHE